jgi:flavin-dependent dehydrogenase
MSTKYVKNGKMNSSLKNMAYWGHWKGQKVYMSGTSRGNAPWFESHSGECGWAWFIPLHNGTVSVGFVMDSETSAKKKATGRPTPPITTSV